MVISPPARRSPRSGAKPPKASAPRVHYVRSDPHTEQWLSNSGRGVRVCSACGCKIPEFADHFVSSTKLRTFKCEGCQLGAKRARAKRASRERLAAAVEALPTLKCSARKFCGALLQVCSLSKPKARGGLEISFSFTPSKTKLKFRETAVVRQDGHRGVILLDYCPFCGVKF
jgi:hypothetical protein